MKEDKLVMQMLGKFNESKLNIQTVINPTLVLESKVENFDSIIKRSMVEAIADKIYGSGKHLTFANFRDPNYDGDVYSYSTYVFSKSELISLIDTVFKAGMEAAKNESN